ESPENTALFGSAFKRALAGEANVITRKPFSIPVPESDGGGTREVFWTCHHLPVRDKAGNICAMLQKAEDVTAEVTTERMRTVIAQEFGHRVKNTLATIGSIARQSATSATTVEAFLDSFQDRISAMARTHQMLADGSWQQTSLAELIGSQLRPFDKHRDQVSILGPHVELTARQSEVLGMAFHELATNAAKYGAFSVADGRLAVTWTLEPETHACIISWLETGLSALSPPATPGFGSKIIDRVLPMELSGRVERTFRPTGLHCLIHFSFGR
ncbi:MAG: sensor histidine kinase, partial [Hyphomicrobium sp.]